MTETKAPRWTAYMPLDEVLKAPRNPKNHNAQVIAASMVRFGVVELPALDERTGRLVAGHGRLEDWQARRSLDEPPPEGVITDTEGNWLVPVSRGWSSRDDSEAEAYLITSNNSVILGGWNEQELNTVLADLARDDFGLAQVTGYGASELEALMDAGLVTDPHLDPGLSTDTFADAGAHPDAIDRTRLPFYDPDGVVEHDAVPRTGASYAETPEEQAAREARVAAYQPRQGHSTGLVEMILVFPIDDRNEAARLIATAREVLGPELKASEIVLRALRALTAVLDHREDDKPVRLGEIARHAGWIAEQADS